MGVHRVRGGCRQQRITIKINDKRVVGIYTEPDHVVRSPRSRLGGYFRWNVFAWQGHDPNSEV